MLGLTPYGLGTRGFFLLADELTTLRLPLFLGESRVLLAFTLTSHGVHARRFLFLTREFATLHFPVLGQSRGLWRSASRRAASTRVASSS